MRKSCSEVIISLDHVIRLPPVTNNEKSRDQFLTALQCCVRACSIPSDATTLILGGGAADSEVLTRAGFRSIRISNLSSEILRTEATPGGGTDPAAVLDAEDLKLPDESVDMVFAHEVLHHCRSPHRALCEMLRVSRNFVMFQEPNDSIFARV